MVSTGKMEVEMETNPEVAPALLILLPVLIIAILGAFVHHHGGDKG